MEWKYLVQVSLGGMEKDGHLIEACPEETKATIIWNTEDKRILALLVNFFDRLVQSVITHYKTVKEL